VDGADERVGSASAYKQIELVWPDKDQPVLPVRGDADEWALVYDGGDRYLHPLLDLHPYPTPAAVPSFVIEGARLDALYTLRRGFAHQVRLAYLDLPRIDVDDKAAAFRGEPDLAYTTWLAVVRAHLEATMPLVALDGIIAIHVGDDDEPLARLVADQTIGRKNRVGTIVWQRAYGPKNMKGMKELTATHDCILIYSVDKESLPAVGMRGAPSGFNNPDDDPRGPWKAEHKGAASRRENSDFDTFIPPYKWDCPGGELPPGLWRISPLTGVIWGTPTQAGSYRFTAQVTDREGATATKTFTIDVEATGAPPEPITPPWLYEQLETTGSLRIETPEALPPAVLGEEYSTLLLALGGTPFRAEPRRPGNNRYWEFARDTLTSAYQRDAVSLGRDGTSIPHPKTYLTDVGDEIITNQQSWWPGRQGAGNKSKTFVGYTEDATKHLLSLQTRGLVASVVKTAKPEPLLSRLMHLFTQRGDTVMQVFGDAGDLASVSLKTERRFIHLAGSSPRERAMVQEIVLPRLRAVVDGADTVAGLAESGVRLRDDAIIPFDGGGAFISATVGTWIAAKRKGDEIPELNDEAYSSAELLRCAVLTSQGYLPLDDNAVDAEQRSEPDGVSFDGASAAVFIAPSEYLTPQRLSDIASRWLRRYSKIDVFYFRASDDLAESEGLSPVTCRRLPFDIGMAV
jgi:hypothetical protein